MNQIAAFLPVIRVFQILGISPFYVDEKFQPKERRAFKFYSLFLIGFSMLSLSGTFVDSDLYLNNAKNDIAHIVDFVQLLTVRIAHLIILCESLFQQKSLISFFENLCAVDVTMKRLKITLRPKKRSFFYVTFIMGLYFGAQCVVLSMLILREAFDLISYWTSYVLPFLVICARYFQIISYVGFIKTRFELLNQRMEEMVLKDEALTEVSTFPPFTSKNIFKLYPSEMKSSKMERIKNAEQLVLMRQMYDKLYVLNMIVNHSFGLSTLVMIAKGFIAITLNCYFVFLRLQITPMQTIDGYKIVESTFWILPHVVNVIALSAVCHFTSLTVTIKLIQ